MDVHAISAKEIMKTNVITVEESVTVIAAAKLLRDNRVSSLVVTPKDKKDAWGIITRKDIVEALVEESIRPAAQLVEHIMSKPALIVAPDLSVFHCLQMMRMMGVRRLPVVENNELKGILSNSDMFAALAAQIQ